MHLQSAVSGISNQVLSTLCISLTPEDALVEMPPAHTLGRTSDGAHDHRQQALKPETRLAKASVFLHAALAGMRLDLDLFELPAPG
jgi:hypothetical protein